MRSFGTAFEKRKTVGIEKRAAQCGHPQGFMFDSAIDGPENGKQTGPGIVSSFQNLVAMLVGFFGQLPTQSGDGVMLIVHRVVEQQEPTLFGTKYKYQPHHHRQSRFVKFGRRNVMQKLPVSVLIGLVQTLDEHLDGTLDLFSESICHFLMMLKGIFEHGRKGLFCRTEPSANTQQ